MIRRLIGGAIGARLAKGHPVMGGGNRRGSGYSGPVCHFPREHSRDDGAGRGRLCRQALYGQARPGGKPHRGAARRPRITGSGRIGTQPIRPLPPV